LYIQPTIKQKQILFEVQKFFIAFSMFEEDMHSTQADNDEKSNEARRKSMKL